MKFKLESWCYPAKSIKCYPNSRPQCCQRYQAGQTPTQLTWPSMLLNQYLDLFNGKNALTDPFLVRLHLWLITTIFESVSSSFTCSMPRLWPCTANDLLQEWQWWSSFGFSANFFCSKLVQTSSKYPGVFLLLHFFRWECVSRSPSHKKTSINCNQQCIHIAWLIRLRSSNLYQQSYHFRLPDHLRAPHLQKTRALHLIFPATLEVGDWNLETNKNLGNFEFQLTSKWYLFHIDKYGT